MVRKDISSVTLIDAIKASGHDATKITRQLDISRATFYNLLKKYPTAKDAWNDEKEKRDDFVEGKLISAIRKGNVTAIIFYLKTQCKDRGYIERQEFTGAEGGALRIEIIDTQESKHD